MANSVPIAAAEGSTSAIARLVCRVGENVPEVTSPIGRSSAKTIAPWRAIRFEFSFKPTRASPGASFQSLSAVLPAKSPLSSLTAQPTPAANGLIDSESSWP